MKTSKRGKNRTNSCTVRQINQQRSAGEIKQTAAVKT